VLFASFRGYQSAWLVADLVAGTLLAAIAIPEQLATARLAGMPPETGLYAFAVATLAFAIVGLNRVLSVGADSTIAPIFAATIAALVPASSPQYVAYVGAIAVLVGAILIVVGLLRAGWVAELLSIPVTIGFLAGIAIRIIVGQLPALFGVPNPHGAPFETALAVINGLDHINPYAVALGVGVFAITMIAERISAKLPGALLGLAAAAIAVSSLHLQSRGVTVLGALHAGLPRFTPPLVPGIEVIRNLVPLAFIVAIVCVVQTAAVLRAYPSSKDGQDDISRDLLGVGVGSVAAGMFGAFPVDASPPRTAVVAESGGRSQLAGVLAVVAIAALVFFGAGLTSNVPEAALAGVLIYIATRIFRIGEMMRIAKESRLEITLVVLAAVLVVLLPINIGVLLAIGISLLYGLSVMVRPPCVELTRVPGTTIWWPPGRGEQGEHVPGVVVFCPAAPIYFMNVHYIVDRLNATIAAAPQPVKLVVIEGSGLIDIDYTGSRAFTAAIQKLMTSTMQPRVALARLSDERAESAARRTGLLAAIGDDCIFRSVDEAIRAML
jgi:SulP family sulfate permease